MARSTGYPKRDPKFDVTDIDAKDDKPAPSADAPVIDRPKADATDQARVNASQQVSEVPIIETEHQMYIALFKKTIQAWQNGDYERANHEARGFIYGRSTPMSVCAGSHRILADAPGSLQDQLIHAKRSLELYERMEREMDPSRSRDKIMHTIEAVRVRVQEAEASLKEFNENPHYYTEEELDAMKSESVKHWRKAYLAVDEDDEDEGNNDDGRLL